MLHVDTRESKHTIATIVEACGLVSVHYLSCADFLLLDKDGHSLGIERKTVSDLLSSLSGRKRQENGKIRLYDQLERMQQEYSHQALLIEGAIPFSPLTGKVPVGGGGWNHLSIQMILWDLPESIYQFHTSTKDATADLLRGLSNRSEKGCVLPNRCKEVAKSA